MQFFKKYTNHNGLYNPKLGLSELANLYETDKGTANARELSWGKEYPSHWCMGYTDLYSKYMLQNREEHLSMLEIGVCDKRFPYASIKMWMSFFKNVDYYAVDNFWGTDLKDKLADIEYWNNNSVNFIYANQGSFTDWDELITLCRNRFDYIIDDGSHWPNHIMVSLWKAINVIKKGGYYFIEDIQNPLKTRGWYKFDNSLITEEFLQSLHSKKLYSSFLNDSQNHDVNNSFELVELMLDKQEICYLAVLRRK